MVAFIEQENVSQHGISIPPQNCLQCRRGPVTSRVIDPPRARKYHAILECSRGRWPTVSWPLSNLIAITKLSMCNEFFTNRWLPNIFVVLIATNSRNKLKHLHLVLFLNKQTHNSSFSPQSQREQSAFYCYAMQCLVTKLRTVHQTKHETKGFIVGKFTLDEDRRLLRLDFGSLLSFFMKNFFPKFELSASAAYTPVFTVLSFLVDSVLKPFKKSPHFQTSNSMINTLTSVSCNKITKLPILCGHSSHSFHSISIRHEILRDFSVLQHDIWEQKDIT